MESRKKWGYQAGQNKRQQSHKGLVAMLGQS
jgi:hypothetical protein